MPSVKSAKEQLILTPEQLAKIEKSAEAIGKITVLDFWVTANKDVADQDKVTPVNAAQRVLEYIHNKGGETDFDGLLFVLFNSSASESQLDTADNILGEMMKLGLVRMQVSKGRDVLRIHRPRVAPPDSAQLDSPWAPVTYEDEYRQQRQEAARSGKPKGITTRAEEERELLRVVQSRDTRITKKAKRRARRR